LHHSSPFIDLFRKQRGKTRWPLHRNAFQSVAARQQPA
jgi:hypothetical protein